MLTQPIAAESTEEIEQARREILAWMLCDAPGQELSDAQLIHSATEWAQKEYLLTLQTRPAGEEEGVEALWVHGESVADWFDSPFLAGTDEDARMLACAGLLRVFTSL